IRFTAAVGSDHAGQAGFNHEVGGFNERLETVEAKAREFHGHDSLLAGRESPCRDNTMEGNVGVWTSRFLRLSAGDNGEAGAFGQPPRGAFPKAFVWVFIEVFAGVMRRAATPVYPS